MMEIECKVLNVSRALLTKKIRAVTPAPKKEFEGLVKIEYWDFPDGRVRKAKDLLRLREFYPKKGLPYTEFVYKSYKGVKRGCKYFDESQVQIPGANMKMLGKIFSRIGLKRTLMYEKKRTLFAFKDFKIELDEHPRIPPFIEIEAGSPRQIQEIIKSLALGDHEQSAESIGELLVRKYPKISLDGLVFRRK